MTRADPPAIADRAVLLKTAVKIIGATANGSTRACINSPEKTEPRKITGAFSTCKMCFL